MKKSSPTLFTLVEELFNCCDYKTSFFISVEKYDWANQENLFAQTNQDSAISHTAGIEKLLA